MTQLQIGDQTIRFDREATAAIYATLAHGDTERCGCNFCKNFAAQRHLAYPPSFRALLEQLGVDVNKEGEAFEYGPVDDGCHLYGGWFYLVAELVTAGERNCIAPDPREDAHHFEYFFTRAHPKAVAFQSGPVLAIEFTTHLKWVLPESPQYKTTSGKTLGPADLGK
jgi:hypothetical protein